MLVYILHHGEKNETVQTSITLKLFGIIISVLTEQRETMFLLPFITIN